MQNYSRFETVLASDCEIPIRPAGRENLKAVSVYLDELKPVDWQEI